jgi:O-antigen ligase
MGIAIAVIALITYLMLLDLNTSTDFDLIDTPLSLDYLAQLDIRFEYYLNTFILVLENGLFGVGLGDFSSVYRQIITEHFNYWGMTDNPHNEYLMIISQTGVIGLILFLWFLAALLKQARDTNSISLGALLVVLISCLFNSSFLDNNDGAFLLIIIALFISSVKKTASISDEA